MSVRDAVIVSTARTPIGRAYKGAFNATPSPTLAAHAIRAAVETRRGRRRRGRRLHHRRRAAAGGAATMAAPPRSAPACQSPPPECRSTGNAPVSSRRP